MPRSWCWEDAVEKPIKLWLRLSEVFRKQPIVFCVKCDRVSRENGGRDGMDLFVISITCANPVQPVICHSCEKGIKCIGMLTEY